MESHEEVLTEIRALSDKVDEILSSPRVRIQPYTTREAAKLLCRSQEWVSDQCRIGLIKSLPGIPYRIPTDEISRLLLIK